jgi:hypothetical protein
VERTLLSAAFDSGANYWQTFRRNMVPILKLSIIGATLLIFTLFVDEIAVNAISTIIFVFSLIAIVFWYRPNTRKLLRKFGGVRGSRWQSLIHCSPYFSALLQYLLLGDETELQTG